MATTYITSKQRFAIVESLVDAMVEVGYIFDDQINQTRIELNSLSNSELKTTCDDWCPDEWDRLIR